MASAAMTAAIAARPLPAAPRARVAAATVHVSRSPAAPGFPNRRRGSSAVSWLRSPPRVWRTGGSRGGGVRALASVGEQDDASTEEDASAVARNPADLLKADGTPRERRRIAVFVEPSPFSHVSGMKNRFLRLIENLVAMGDDVVVITPDNNPPATYFGAQVIGVKGLSTGTFKLPFYKGNTLLLSYAKDPRVEELFRTNPPDIMHCSSPGALIWTACGLAKKYNVPLVHSYHTHLPVYIPRYTWDGLVKPMWDIIRIWTRSADLTMVTSKILQDELRGEGCPRLEVWQKGVDTVSFNPSFRSEEMHSKLCGGRPGKVIGCVGRLGAEKNLYDLKDILAKCPEGTNLALIGDGPEREKLEEHFKGTNTTFMGMMLGDDLSEAYASLDVFVMPSESETLGFVVMEAMASGVPVVAVAKGGLQDILTNTPEVGQLYPSGDFTTAAKLTSELLTDEKEWARQSGTCRAAVEEWSWMASNKKLRDVQYAMAVNRFKRNDRIKIFIDLVDSRKRFAQWCRLTMNYQWVLQFAGYVVGLGALMAARSVLVKSGVAAAITSQSWLATVQAGVQASGPLGPAVMASAIAAASLVPFVPTQPLFMTAGLLFGTAEGAIISLIGAVEAAFFAFVISRQQGVARIASTLATGAGFGAPIRRLVRDQLKKVEVYLESGSQIGMFVKLALYRLVPHAPFTVSNYLLGLSKAPLPTFMASTAVGMAPWCAFYALVGSTGSAFAAGSLSDALAVVMSGFDMAMAAAMAIVLLWGPTKSFLMQLDGQSQAASGGSVTA